ncbi:MAG: hypothetical protein CMM10_03365 [Rhodospirillaceae bacterium]|jgi:hypothetical protein|nr:hypothetical protein [Rhodospirillaceae bacterium]|tara:strand:- start:1432 stop:1659 length:228 start_codon:yes stop_codon:yes gene_type:complete
METKMFDERDLDHRLYGWKTPIEEQPTPLFELIETSRRVGNRERNKAVDETLAKWIGKLKNISGERVDPVVNAAG